MDHIKEHIAQRIISLIAFQLALEPGQVKPISALEVDLHADSLDRIEITMGLEDEFDITIPDDEADKITTVQQAIDYIKGRIAPATQGENA